MTRTMYDAISASNIPASATLIAGYGDGLYDDFATERARFPHARVVEIAVFAHDNLGVVLDVENGDATPAEAPGWVRMRRAAGVDPTVYCDSSTWPEVQAAFVAAGMHQPHYWIAQYDGNPTIPPGAVAKQYADRGPYDLSSVADYWPGVDPAPVPAPKPTPAPTPSTSSEDDMPLFTVTPGGAQCGVTFARGSAHNVSFFCDNTYVGGATDPGATLRIVVWASGKAPEVHEGVVVNNKGGNQVTVNFTDPSMTHTVTVTRTDTGKPYPVFAEVS